MISRVRWMTGPGDSRDFVGASGRSEGADSGGIPDRRCRVLESTAFLPPKGGADGRGAVMLAGLPQLNKYPTLTAI